MIVPALVLTQLPWRGHRSDAHNFAEVSRAERHLATSAHEHTHAHTAPSLGWGSFGGRASAQTRTKAPSGASPCPSFMSENIRQTLRPDVRPNRSQSQAQPRQRQSQGKPKPTPKPKPKQSQRQTKVKDKAKANHKPGLTCQAFQTIPTSRNHLGNLS